jgi:hypothetical protein
VTDMDLSPNAILIIYIANSLAWAFCGAAIAFGIIERRERNAARKTKHTPINLHT